MEGMLPKYDIRTCVMIMDIVMLLISTNSTSLIIANWPVTPWATPFNTQWRLADPLPGAVIDGLQGRIADLSRTIICFMLESRTAIDMYIVPRLYICPIQCSRGLLGQLAKGSHHLPGTTGDGLMAVCVDVREG